MLRKSEEKQLVVFDMAEDSLVHISGKLETPEWLLIRRPITIPRNLAESQVFWRNPIKHN